MGRPSAPSKPKSTYDRARYVANRERRIAQQRAYEKANPEKVQDGRLRATFGITLLEYNQRLLAQDGVCAICKRPEWKYHSPKGKLRALAVEHDHKTGKVRGLCCGRCNSVLGYVEDDPLLLLALADYLRRNGS